MENIIQSNMTDNNLATSTDTSNFDFESSHTFDNLIAEALKDKEQNKPRSTSFKGTSFEKMTKTEDDEKEL